MDSRREEAESLRPWSQQELDPQQGSFMKSAGDARPLTSPGTVFPEEAECWEEQLTEEERRYAEAFADRIDLTDRALVLRYGAAGQKKAASFADHILSGIHGGDSEQMDEESMEEMIVRLLEELRKLDPGEIQESFRKNVGNGRWGFGTGNKGIRKKYTEIQERMDGIAGMMEQHQNRLCKEILYLDKMYEASRKNEKELSLYLLAGKIALQRGRAELLPNLEKQSADNREMHLMQQVADTADICHHLERRLHDLEVSRMMSMQMGPQIRLIQGNHRMMSEKIQSILQHTIPLWKSQVLLLLGLRHGAEAAAMEEAVKEADGIFFRECNREIKNLLDEVLGLYREDRKEKGRMREALVKEEQHVLKLETDPSIHSCQNEKI